MRYRVTHVTTYSYEEIVSIGHNEVRLEPRSTPRQRRPVTALAIEPTPAVIATELDYFGNPTTFFTVQEPHSETPQPYFVPQSRRLSRNTQSRGVDGSTSTEIALPFRLSSMGMEDLGPRRCRVDGWTEVHAIEAQSGASGETLMSAASYLTRPARSAHGV